MPGYYDIIYPDSRPDTEYAGMRGNYYELPDGSQVDVLSRPCWCVNCNSVTDGEWIESIAELEQKSQDLNNPETDTYKFHEQTEEIAKIPGVPCERVGFRENAIEKNNERLKWRRLRVDSPKCIICGSRSIHYPDENNDGAVTIDGTIVVWIRNRRMCSTLFNEWFFTVDGDRIPRDTQPKYCGIPKNAT